MVGIIREIVRFQALREGKYSSPTPPACLGKLIPVVGKEDHPSVQLLEMSSNAKSGVTICFSSPSRRSQRRVWVRSRNCNGMQKGEMRTEEESDTQEVSCGAL